MCAHIVWTTAASKTFLRKEGKPAFSGCAEPIFPQKESFRNQMFKKNVINLIAMAYPLGLVKIF